MNDNQWKWIFRMLFCFVLIFVVCMSIMIVEMTYLAVKS